MLTRQTVLQRDEHFILFAPDTHPDTYGPDGFGYAFISQCQAVPSFQRLVGTAFLFFDFFIPTRFAISGSGIAVFFSVMSILYPKISRAVVIKE